MSLERARAGVSARLKNRRPEIAQAALARIGAVAEPGESAEPEYVEGMQAAISAALDYGLACIEAGEERTGPPPPLLLAQARSAARNGVSLETVIRRYFAGYTLLGDFLLQEASDTGLRQGPFLRRVLQSQAALFDRLVVAVTEEYRREWESRSRGPGWRQVDRVKRLLAGELVDTAELSYEVDAWHLGAVAVGRGAASVLRGAAETLGRRLLLVRPQEGEAWAWLGGRHRLDPGQLQELLSQGCPGGSSLAIGEPGQGLAGWRLTHRQARAALSLAARGCDGLVRYRDVALTASMLRDDLLATSLRQLYLEPLEKERDGGEVLRGTLRAYFAAERNVSSAAAALKVNRHTVTNRLRTVEERLGRSLSTCTVEMDAALRLEDLHEPLLPYSAFARE